MPKVGGQLLCQVALIDLAGEKILHLVQVGDIPALEDRPGAVVAADDQHVGGAEPPAEKEEAQAYRGITNRRGEEDCGLCPARIGCNEPDRQQTIERKQGRASSERPTRPTEQTVGPGAY